MRANLGLGCPRSPGVSKGLNILSGSTLFPYHLTTVMIMIMIQTASPEEWRGTENWRGGVVQHASRWGWHSHVRTAYLDCVYLPLSETCGPDLQITYIYSTYFSEYQEYYRGLRPYVL